ncbi:proteasome-activating nucleotidase [Methanosarcinales archaeon]|nr:MAG: proteasome-activating nucleotidase [Methanosarcinales archaeon]
MKEVSSSGSASFDEDYAKYLLDKIKQLEEANLILKTRLESLERERRREEELKLRYEREIRKLRSEIERLRAPPLIVGTIVEVIDDRRAIVKSSTGPRFVVNYSQFLNRRDIQPGVQVALNQQSLSVIGVLPSQKDPFVYGMEVIEAPDVTYEMIGGLKEQIEEIREVVELPLSDPERFEKLGVEPPRGVLLVGPPGTGKTMLAKAVANRTSATFIRVIGSELVQKYIGEGARLVRELFELAREKAPSIVFIDEIDAIAARRDEDSTSGEREVQRTMMQLLAEIDGFDPRGDVKVIGATNRPDILDPALLRPGRFDRIIFIPLPDAEGREEIFRIHTSKMKLAPNVDLKKLASLSEGATGADIKAICTEAGMFAVKQSKNAVEMEDFERAIRKIMRSEQSRYTKSLESGVMFA